MLPDRGPNVRFPPPALFVAGFLVGLWLDADVARLGLVGNGGDAPLAAQIGGLGFVGIGASIAVWGALTFRRAGTPVVPVHPATTMVTSGPYRFTRNPMYLGLTLAYVGIALALSTAWPVILLPAVLTALFLFVIRREERHLSQTFGTEYAAYKTRVRRWI